MNGTSIITRIKPYVRLLFRWGWFVVVCILATTATTYFIPDNAALTTYTATLHVQVMLPVASNGKVDINASTAFYASLFTKNITLHPLVNTYMKKYPGFSKSDVLAALQSSVVTLPITNTNYFQLSATPSFANASQQDAVTLVNAVFNEGVKDLQQRRNTIITTLSVALNNELKQSQDALNSTATDMSSLAAARQTDTFVYLEDESLYKAQLSSVTSLQKQLQTLQLQTLNNDSLLQITNNRADILTNTGSAPTQRIRYAFAPLIGLLMGVGGAMLASMFSVRVPLRGKKRELVLPGVVATIPPLTGVRHNELTTIRATSPGTALLRHLRYQSSEHEQALGIVTVTSPSGGEGKSFVAASLAFAAAQSGLRTVLVDAHARRPVLHTWFQTANVGGLLDGIESTAKVERDLLAIQPTFHARLGLLPGGQKSIATDALSEDLPLHSLRIVVERLRSQADMIIFDASALLDDANAANIIQLSDIAILVVDARTSKSGLVTAAEDVLKAIAVPSVIVLNRADLETIE